MNNTLEQSGTESEEKIDEQEEEEFEEEKEEHALYDYFFWNAISLLLSLTAGCCSGLTVGYLSIEKIDLEIKLKSGTE